MDSCRSINGLLAKTDLSCTANFRMQGASSMALLSALFRAAVTASGRHDFEHRTRPERQPNSSQKTDPSPPPLKSAKGGRLFGHWSQRIFAQHSRLRKLLDKKSFEQP